MRFEIILAGLSLAQKRLLQALAQKPTDPPRGTECLTTNQLSVRAVQKAVRVLIGYDLIERRPDRQYQRVDAPVADPAATDLLEHSSTTLVDTKALDGSGGICCMYVDTSGSATGRVQDPHLVCSIPASLVGCMPVLTPLQRVCSTVPLRNVAVSIAD